jgi:hypothetical protein
MSLIDRRARGIGGSGGGTRSLFGTVRISLCEFAVIACGWEVICAARGAVAGPEATTFEAAFVVKKQLLFLRREFR